MAFSFFLNYRDDIKLQIRSKLCDIANKGQATRLFELRRKAQISKKMVINTVHPGKAESSACVEDTRGLLHPSVCMDFQLFSKTHEIRDIVVFERLRIINKFYG